jgi:quinol monooxygenase YgiN
MKPFSSVEENELLFYQIKIVIKPFKTEEFVKSMRSFSRKIRKEKGCLGHSVYRDSEKENIYSVVGEWQTRPAMEKHFKSQNFELVMGAARVLGETFEMNIAEVLETGGFKLARKHIAAQD